MFLIEPRLYLSNWTAFSDASETAGPVPFYQVNCTRDLPMVCDSGARGFRVPVDDDGSAESNDAMRHNLPAVVDMVCRALSAGETVVVHCKAGQQRSPAVIAAYLMVSRGMDAATAMEAVRVIKPDAFLWVANFHAALKGFEGDSSRKPMQKVGRVPALYPEGTKGGRRTGGRTTDGNAGRLTLPRATRFEMPIERLSAMERHGEDRSGGGGVRGGMSERV
jgi:hypothetical protein